MVNILYRTYSEEKDLERFQKIYHAAFCNGIFCQPKTAEFMRYKYGAGRPFYNPDGYLFAEYNHKFVGAVMSTLREMDFQGKPFLMAAIDDVSTCPVMEKRGIGSTLMANAMKFMKETNADLSILTADPNGHARKIYERLGYRRLRTTWFGLAIKILSIARLIQDRNIITPLIGLFYPTQKVKSIMRLGGRLKELEFEVISSTTREFLDCVNRNYGKLTSFHPHDHEYWTWNRLRRPPEYQSVCLAARKDGRIVGGGAITKQKLMVLNPKRYYSISTLTELFVDEEYRRKGIGGAILHELEKIAVKRLKTGFMLTHYPRNDWRMKFLLRKNGYFVLPAYSMMMIRPISARFKRVFEKIKDKNVVWNIPWEHLGW